MINPEGLTGEMKFSQVTSPGPGEEFFCDGRGISRKGEIVDTKTFKGKAYLVKIRVKAEVVNGYAAFWGNLYFDNEYKCTFLPHLSPLEDTVIGEKVLRGAPIILENDENIVGLLPNFNEYKKEHRVPYIMDYDRKENRVKYGIGHHREYGHTYFKLTGDPIETGDEISFSFYLFAVEKRTGSQRNYMDVNNFIWDVFAEGEMTPVIPDPLKLVPYALHTYNWAFNNWKDATWQEFTINGKRVGGVVFILTAWQKPGLGFENRWREPKSIWNQAWFCSLRSAYGYYSWGKETRNKDLMEKGRMALNFALVAPKNKGLFPGYYEAGENNDMGRGKFHTSAPRRPENHEGYYHLADSSWTCYWLLKWYEDIERDERIIPFVADYIENLLEYHQPDGSFPAWVKPDGGEVSPYLLKSPESACHLMLLTKMYGITKEERLLKAAKMTGDFIAGEIIPRGRWEDFETYWSCAGQWERKQFGCVDRRSGLYNQNTLGMYWSGEGLLELYKLTSDIFYLNAGEQVVAEFSLYQQLYRPHDFEVEALGGFGVMNSDDEWNDARQSLFALVYLKYFIETKKEMYRIKALWSMKASFYMMYCPENPETKKLYEKVYPFFDEGDYGFHMENYKHNDGTQKMGLGEFTIFDWGNGAASATLYEFLKLAGKFNIAGGKINEG